MNQKGLKLKETLSAMAQYAGIETIDFNRHHDWIDINTGGCFLLNAEAYSVIKRADRFYNAFQDIDYQTALKYALVYILGSDFLAD